jgi:thiol-disulfide isomerase/thioredoxin
MRLARVVSCILFVLAVAPPALVFAEDAAPAAASKLADTKLDEDFPRATLPDAISGQELSLVAARGPQATVLVCLATDCPISTEYTPTIVAIANAYRERGVAFVGINPNGGVTLEQMAAYARAEKLPFPFTKDAGGKISRKLLFSVTPEARVFDANGKLVYSGRVDDRYRRGGATDKDVAKDLENALDEVLAGKPVSAARTKAIGCPLQVAEPSTSTSPNR